MLVSEILRILPPSLEWMVLFNLSPIRNLVDENIIKAMYDLPTELDLTPYSHVVLANSGHFLASVDQCKLVEVISAEECTIECPNHSLCDRFAEQLALFPVDEADCLGLGTLPSYPPVLLHITIQQGIAQAQAIFEKAPNREHYELLRAVGVKFLGGEYQGKYYLAQFQNRLPVHIHAGILSYFARTGHCNIFFLQHGTIDPPLEQGLLQAAEGRIGWAVTQSTQMLRSLAQEACNKSLAMICQSPLGDGNFPYGDLVPLGFVLNGLNKATNINSTLDPVAGTSIEDAREGLKQFLLDKRQDKLWAFQCDRLITATDSALILQGFNYLVDSIEALERFADGKGGYYPQLWCQEQQPGKMLLDDSCLHWCQADYATTCMIRSLRQDAQLEVKTPIDYLSMGMNSRSGLYFANPYLVDWVLARAISQDASAALLRQQLLSEVLASLNEDYSFGKYDIALSTALGILIMAALGCRGRTMRAVQIRLLEFMDTQGRWPVSTPFYSSLTLPSDMPTKDLLALLMAKAFVPKTSIQQQQQIKKINNKYYGISLYWDVHRCISTSLAVLALLEPCSPSELDLVEQLQDVHPRYLCHNHCEYIAKFAIPPYSI